MGGFLGLVVAVCCIAVPAVVGIFAIAAARNGRKENSLGGQGTENNVQEITRGK